MDNLLDHRKFLEETKSIRLLKLYSSGKSHDRDVTDPMRYEKKRLRKRNKRSAKNRMKQLIKQGNFEALND